MERQIVDWHANIFVEVFVYKMMANSNTALSRGWNLDIAVINYILIVITSFFQVSILKPAPFGFTENISKSPLAPPKLQTQK